LLVASSDMTDAATLLLERNPCCTAAQ
jgi:hypothetical protein